MNATFAAVLNSVNLIANLGDPRLRYYLLVCAVLIIFMLILIYLMTLGCFLNQRAPAYQKYRSTTMLVS